MPPHRSALDNGIDRLFHYQRYNAEHLRRTVQDRLIRFAAPDEFNDPWDCKPLFHVPEDEAGIRELVEFMYRASERFTQNFDPAERVSRAEHYLQNPDALRKDLAEGSAEMWAQMNRCYRLYCFSTKPDCPLMWAHYADHHRGVCLVFNVRTNDICSATQVNYSTDYPRYSLSDDTDLSPFYSKSADWAYEEEYRLVAQEESEALGSGTLMTRNGMYQYSSGALLSIIIGSSATAATAEEIYEMARAAGVLVRKAARVPNRYALTIDPPIN
jgi:hypothetical protein